MSSKSLLSTINRWCALASGFILVIGLVAVLYAVLARSVFNQPAAWAFDLTSYGMLFVVFLATARTMEQDGHVRIDFLLSHLKGRARLLVEVIVQALGLVFILLLLWATTRKTIEAIEGDWVSPSIYEFPLRTIYWIMPAGMTLLLLTALVKFSAAVSALRHAGSSPVTHRD